MHLLSRGVNSKQIEFYNKKIEQIYSMGGALKK